MNEKPEAARLANILQAQADRDYAFVDDFRYSAAAELRRLHAENERLREALESIAANACCDKCQEAALVARAALRREE